MTKLYVMIGALAALAAVALGAFGAHGLRARLGADMMSVYETAVQYHFYHALGLLLIGLAATHFGPTALLRWSGLAMILGLVLFSGSLYALSVTGVRWLGAITPFGGTAFMLGWLLLALAAWRSA
jgi:uncharacterized membrane protein YgdD (TMEM256/DUF423 family)